MYELDKEIVGKLNLSSEAKSLHKSILYVKELEKYFEEFDKFDLIVNYSLNLLDSGNYMLSFDESCVAKLKKSDSVEKRNYAKTAEETIEFDYLLATRKFKELQSTTIFNDFESNLNIPSNNTSEAIKHAFFNISTQTHNICKSTLISTENCFNETKDLEIQYEPQMMSESVELKIQPHHIEYIELILKHNSLIDACTDDILLLTEDETIKEKLKITLNEYQTFTDPKKKSISKVQVVNKAIVIVNYVDKYTFDERITSALDSYLLIWSFNDTIHPLITLTSNNTNIHSFHFSSEQNLIVAGTSNGQLLVYDLSRHSFMWNSSASTANQNQHIVCNYSYSTSIESSHTSAITNILCVEARLITCALDGYVCLWDYSIQSCKLLHKIQCSDYSIERLLLNSTHAIAATVDGDLIQINDIQSTETKSVEDQIQLLSSAHSEITDIQLSPFHPNILLLISFQSISIYHTLHLTTPLFTFTIQPSYYTSALFSPTRPFVFYASLANGSIQVFDLSDNTNSFVFNKAVCSVGITTLGVYTHTTTSTGKTLQLQYIAAGDDLGTTHVLEINRNLCRALKNERVSFMRWTEREVKRVQSIKKEEKSTKKLDKNSEQTIQPKEEKTAEQIKEVDKNVDEIDTIEKQFADMERMFLNSVGLSVKQMESEKDVEATADQIKIERKKSVVVSGLVGV